MIKTIDGISPRQFALQHCNKGKRDCCWYHGSWHLLKSLGVVSTSAVHEHSIIALLKKALSGNIAPRILLTGSTDETLVRLVHQACLSPGINETIYAVDICATPLAFMQAYADENRIELTTCHSDILAFETEQKFDVILTHAFMGYFDDSQRPVLINKWRQLLADQGKIITIQRIRPAGSPAIVTFSEQQASQFVTTAIEAAKHSALDASERDTVKKAASDFAEKFVNYAITDKTALESLFADAGLSFHFLEYCHLEKKGDLSGPSVPSDAEFAHIIAEKSQPKRSEVTNDS
jgi:phospholipid N-methyltransferase